MAPRIPFVSIIIANYNYGHLLSFALDSILAQDDDDFEIIVVDGGSTDNSVEVIRKYEAHISWWISEPDHGQSEAFNKGFKHAKGKFLTWLNADDLLLPGTILAVKTALRNHPEASWATGNMVRFLHQNGEIIEAPWGPHYLPKWLQGKGRVTISFGPSTFWSRDSYNQIGPINENLHYAMDFDYWTRLNHAGYLQVRVNHFCWGFRMHEVSKTAEFGLHHKSEKENKEISRENNSIAEALNYHPSMMWRFLGLLMRFLDGSMVVALKNRFLVKGENIKECFKLNYK